MGTRVILKVYFFCFHFDLNEFEFYSGQGFTDQSISYVTVYYYTLSFANPNQSSFLFRCALRAGYV